MSASKVNDLPYPLPKECVEGKIGVVTVTYNSSAVMPDFIKSIESQVYTQFAVYIIDNASSDNTLAQLDRWKQENIQVVRNAKNIGVAAGNNQGIRAALNDGCEFVLLLNNDVVFGKYLFEQLMHGIKRYKCDMVTPKIYYHSRSDVLWCAGGALQKCLFNRTRHYGEGLRDDHSFDEAKSVSYAPTCCVLIHRTVFSLIGIMDERYFVYCDDTDFMVRSSRAGSVLYYLPDAKLWHKVSSLSGSQSDFSLFYSTRGRSLLIRKHSGLPAVYLWAACYSLFCFTRWCAGKDEWRKMAIRIKGTREGILAAKG